jgi:L-seryl-tRNA(Ser) seleniumtransferase
MDSLMSDLRSLPSVDHLLQNPSVVEWVSGYGRPLTVDAVRQVLENARQEHRADGAVPPPDRLVERIGDLLRRWTTPSLISVINATGVVLHTNLGRAPLSRAAQQAVLEVSSGYSNLEFDLERGKRGSRLLHAETLLRQLTGAEAALVVNNNASAVLLALSSLARRRSVVIARSQLVEIGGGFRIPEVMKQSGARLVEVGATNRVHLEDYRQAIDDHNPALILRVHRSNFRISGFTGEPGLDELAELAHQAGLPLVDDLGSGTLLDTESYGLEHEPTIQESLQCGRARGADLVAFSGDKLLGGPQAGILLGKAELIGKMRKNPLARALRADKLCLAALSATLMHYLKNEAEQEIPVWRMISASPAELQARAVAWAEVLGQGQVIAGLSTIGGGSLPGETLPTSLLALQVSSPNRFLRELRASQPPIIARLENDRVLFDPRTVLPDQEQTMLEGIRRLIPPHLQASWHHPGEGHRKP